MWKIDINEVFYIFSDHPNLQLGPSCQKTTRQMSPRFIPPTKAAASPPRLVFPTAWTCPMSSPQDLFLPRDFHQFLFFFLWPLLRDQPSLGSTGHHCSSNGRAGAAPQGRSCLRAHRILPAARCHRTDFALGPFLPSPWRVSISCFHFQWLGILGVDKGGLQHFRSNLFLSIQSLVSLLLVLWNKVLFKQKRRKKIMKESY